MFNKMYFPVFIMFLIFSAKYMNAKEIFEFDSPGQSASAVPERSKVDVQYKWNLSDIYSSEQKWQEDFDVVLKEYPNILKFRNKLGDSPDNLLGCLKLKNEYGLKFDKVQLYASLSHDLNLADIKSAARYEEVRSLGSKIKEAESYLNAEILTISEEKIKKYLNSNPELLSFRHFLDNIIRLKSHTLNQNEERLMALSTPLEPSYMSIYKVFVNAEFKFPSVKDEKGEDFELSMGRYYNGMYSQDRAFRERVYKGIYQPFMQFKNTLAEIYLASIKYKIFNAKSRNYKSTLEAALSENNIPANVYTNLVNTVNANIEPMARFCELKKKYLKLDKMTPYDTYVSLLPGFDKSYSYEEAVQIVLKALEPLGKEYIETVRQKIESRHIDVFETKGKVSGAYSSDAVKGVLPYILLNWSGKLNDVFTLAHELGHNMHSYFTTQTQPVQYADYSIFLAEIASTANESLLIDYLLKTAKSKEERISIIEHALNSIQSTFYRQTRFAEFEMIVQSRIENGEVMTSESLAELFGELFAKYWGPAMDVPIEEKYSWSRIHHFFYDFYVYQYATGLSAASLLSAKILKEGKPAIDRYMKFLQAGNSDYAVEILKNAGVDMTTPAPIESLTERAMSLVLQLEELLGEK
ncbi:MAG: oligoendopeptidase [Bacteroidota bacterium]|nr:oligoendopeptidase [Bacteroidota bacterium]